MIIAHYYFLKRSRGKALIFSNIQALKRMNKGNIITANLTHLIIRCLTIFVLIIAVSGATIWVMGERSDVNIIFALDSSASMTSPDIGSSRFESAKSIISELVNNMPSGPEYALITFAGVSKIQRIFTQEKTELLLSLDQTEIFRIGGTDVGGAIITATNLFESKPEQGKMLIIISDGLDNAGSFITGTMDEAIFYAKQNQVVIHSIAIGTEAGPLGFLPEYYQIPASFNDEIMILMSEETGGTYHRVETTNDIQTVINEITLETNRAYINHNLYYWAPILVFLFLIIEWVLANTMYRRVL